MHTPEYTIILFYKFFEINDSEEFRIRHRAICEQFNLKGRMLIAHEGVNATFEGKTEDIRAYIDRVRQEEHFGDIVFKESAGFGEAFTKLIVRVRKEIVTLGAGEFNVAEETAKEISVEGLRELYEKNEDFVVLDLRNDYEIDAGYFEKTVNPKLRYFRDLPEKLPELESLKGKKVVTVCTGGIRCEKATCLLKRKGFENIYQLKDGIHTYMQKYPGENFKGSLFVFDNRMTTPVVEGSPREIVAQCIYCRTASEDYYSDDSVRPSKKIICCQTCIIERKGQLRRCIEEVHA
jgi:UPF0176 protein